MNKNKELHIEMNRLAKLTLKYLKIRDIESADVAYKNLINAYHNVENKNAYDNVVSYLGLKLNEIKTKPPVNRNLTAISIAIILLAAIIIPAMYFDLDITGFFDAVNNLTEDGINNASAQLTELAGFITQSNYTNESEANLSVSIIQEINISGEKKLDILNYSCSWNGSNFRICESVEWSGGSYAKGYISGGESIDNAPLFNSTPFSYCQDVENEGKKAVNAYLLNEKEEIIHSNLTYKADCSVGNDSVVVVINQTELIEANVSEITNKTTSNGTIETLIQYGAVINQPVKWKKTIALENETGNLEVELPKGAKVLSVKEIENNESRDITNEVLSSVNETPLALTGLAIFEEDNSTSLLIEQNVSEVEIEYETEAPRALEEEINGGKRVTVSSETHYENILTFTSIKEARKELIRLYWIVNGTRVSHTITNYLDTNNDSLIDQIYWITPHLSNQTFEIVIALTKASHLDSNYTFISDVYNETKALDNIWSEPIYDKEYVRVTFQQNLTADNDITAYLRNSQGTNTSIEVYEFNSSNKITEFNSITSEGYYKVLLTGMNGSSDTFDLKIRTYGSNTSLADSNNSYLEFDYIVDPSPQPGITAVNINSTNPALNDTNQNITLTLVNVTAATKNLTSWFVNGARWMMLNMPFENGSNSTFTRDYSGSNNSGINNGTVDGAIFNSTGGLDGNGAYEFNGSGSNISMGDPADLSFPNNTFTFAFWMKAANTTGGNPFRKGGSPWEYSMHTLSSNSSSGILSAIAWNSGGTDVYTHNSVTYYNANEWTFFVWTADGVTSTVYRNAVSQASATKSGQNMSNTAKAFHMGITGNAAGPFYMNGTIDDFLVINRSISAAEVRALYNNRTDLIVSNELLATQNWSACVTPTNTSTEGPTVCSGNYSVNTVGAGGCGDIANSVTLVQNVTSVGTCYNITADNVVLDCAGYGITYGTVNAGNGVTADNRTNVTVQNCFILDNSSTNAFGIGINFTRTNLSLIYNNTIDTNGTTDNYGIQIRGLTGTTGSITNRIENNTIRTLGSGANNYGIYLFTRANNTNVTGNIIFTNGTSSNFGIRVDTDSGNNIIGEMNNITVSGTSSTNHGVYITARSLNNNVSGNIMNASGTNTNNGFLADGASNNTLVINNTVRTEGRNTGSDHGIRVTSKVFFTNITHNRVNTSGTSSEMGIYVLSNADRGVIEYNNISTSGNSTSNAGIRSDTASGNNITGNIIIIGGTSSNDGILLNTDTNTTIVDGNNITIQSSGATNPGIRVVTRSINNNLTNNVINTSGTDTNIGIRLDTSVNNTLVMNNSITSGGSTTTNSGIRITTKSFFNNITHNRMSTSGTSSNYGVDLTTNADYTVIEYNNLTTNGTIDNNHGINQATSWQNNITNNLIVTNSSSANSNEGIRIDTDSNNTIIDNNNITTMGIGSQNYGIYLFRRSIGINVTNNIINTSGTNTNVGINIDTSANNTLALNNSILTGGSAQNNFGVRITTKVFFNNITHNRILSRGTNDNYGVQLTTNGDINVIEYNNISTNGTTTIQAGISSTTSTGNNITNNIIFTNGSTDNYGIRLTTDTNNTIIDNNNITTTGSGASNFGINMLTRVTANNVTNNIINTSGTSGNPGIQMTTGNTTLILNNSIVAGGSTSGNAGIIILTKAFFNNVTHNRISTIGTQDNLGIDFRTNADFSVAEYNNISANGTTTSNFGIRVQTSWQDNVTNNIIATNGSSSNEGIRITTDANNTIVDNNNITTTGSAGSNFGINLVTRSSGGINVTNNLINTSGTTNNHGIVLDTSVNSSLILNNTVGIGGSGSTNIGMRLLTKSFFNNFTHNRITGKGGTSDNYGMDLRSNADINVIEYNNISTNGTTSINYGILQITATGNNITNNVIFTNGTSNNEGIRIQTDSNNTVIDNNKITTTGTSSSNFGINLLTRNAGINVTNNIINTSGTSSNYGISITTANTTIMLNNSILIGGPNGANRGINIVTKSFFNNVTHNRILTGAGTSLNEGVHLENNADISAVEYNNITTNGSTTDNYGVSVTTSTGDNVTNNVIATNGSSVNYGILVTLDANNTILDKNNISTVRGTTSHGIFLFNRGFGINVTENFINFTGTNSQGIRLGTSINTSLIYNNTITADATGGSKMGILLITNDFENNVTFNVINTSGTNDNYGIWLDTGTSNNSVAYNRINTSGTSTAQYGIALTSNSDNNTINRNNITTGGSSAANHGIYVNLNSSNNNVTNNIINSTGSGTVYGIAVENITEGNSMNRFDSNNISVSSAGSFAIFLRAANDTIFNNTYINDGPNWTSSARGNNNNSFENTTFANINGTINFRGTFQFNGTSDITLALLNTTFNRSFVNSSNLTFLNTTATVRLYIPLLNNPKMLFNSEDNGSYLICPSSKCTNVTYANPVFTFNVTSWTSFAIANNTYPSVTLVNPPSATANASKQHIFRAIVTDVEGLFNATLYHNISGSWVANQTVLLNGTSNATNFNVAKIFPGSYLWNVQVCDSDYLCRQATSNFTFTVLNVTECGNNVKEGSEICDGTDLVGQNCVKQGFVAGTLSCSNACNSYDTSKCYGNLEATPELLPDVSGTTPVYTNLNDFEYYVDIDNNYDFATTRAQKVYITLKGGTYIANVEEQGKDYAVLKIEYPDGREPSLVRFALGQTIGIALENDNTFDVFFTLVDILTRRAVFHVEKGETTSKISSRAVKETPRAEKLTSFFSLDYKAADLIVGVLALVFIALFLVAVVLALVVRRHERE